MTPRPKTVMVRITDLNVRAFSATKVLLEFLHLRSFTARVGGLDNRAGIQEVLGNGVEHTSPKLAPLGTEDLLHPTIDTKSDRREFWGSGSIDELHPRRRILSQSCKYWFGEEGQHDIRYSTVRRGFSLGKRPSIALVS
jgi:hypothetical protein